MMTQRLMLLFLLLLCNASTWSWAPTPIVATRSTTSLVATVQSNSPSATTPLASTVRTTCRKATGLSWTAIRATMGGITGISATALYASTVAATNEALSTLLRTLLSLFPAWTRYFIQPLLIVWYVPLFALRSWGNAHRFHFKAAQRASQRKYSTKVVQDEA